jgi:hypothetical protein
MNIIACDFYRMKPEVLPPQAKPRGLYVRPGRLLPAYVKPAEWELVRHGASAGPAVAAEVERLGYCAEELAA